MGSLSTNYSLYSIPAMVLVSYYPTAVKGAIMTNLGIYNNVVPRGNLPKLQAKPNPKVSPELAAKLARCEGAHYNGLENLPFFGLSILASNYVGLKPEVLNVAAGLYIALRVLYNYIYINNTKVSTSFVRTLVWNIGIAIPFYLSIKAAANVPTR
ncbi:hypothetical protein CPB83DRAFT_303282 [Crepidotus variabilis]|uniref:Uncharacterized protein n=1 Tax=Crepidotus variabilis TaxID=179855 RepID=A0A9P6JPJ7_9AGAR|nr:hypothetical protein CPB83DRAFT_303282 [Crepidotus variabilis]